MEENSIKFTPFKQESRYQSIRKPLHPKHIPPKTICTLLSHCVEAKEKKHYCTLLQEKDDECVKLIQMKLNPLYLYEGNQVNFP